jgi:hypothetical protein
MAIKLIFNSPIKLLEKLRQLLYIQLLLK